MPRRSSRTRITASIVVSALLAVAIASALSITARAAEPSPADDTAVAKAGENEEGNPDSAASPGIKVGRAHSSSSYPLLRNDKPIFILVLGSDSRSKQPNVIARGRSDSIHLIGINPAKDQASILGFPRDAWVNIPGHGGNKINDAMYFGGPQGAIAMMESLTGIKIDYYVLAGFYDFRDIVTGIGGVKVDVPYAFNDDHAKIHVKPGPEVMMGKEALGFNRARYGVPGGDFGRSENQGFFLISMLKQFRSQFAKDPSVFVRYLAAVEANIQTDLSFEELTTLAFTINQVDPKTITNEVAPGSIGQEGSESVVHLSSSANALYADMRGDGLLKSRG